MNVKQKCFLYGLSYSNFALINLLAYKADHGQVLPVRFAIRNSLFFFLWLYFLFLCGCSPVVDDESAIYANNKQVDEVVEEVIATESPLGDIIVPDDYSTIQTAIDNARRRDVIVVRPDIYKENINFKGKKITLQSTNPNDPEIVATTVIDGNNSGTVVTINSGENSEAFLTGFTITGGTGTHGEYEIESYDGTKLNFVRNYGGGILISNGSSPVISKNIIYNNSASNIDDQEKGVGGGIAVLDSSSPHIVDNIISKNFAGGHGGGIAVWYQSNPTIENNTIKDNVAGDIGGGILTAMLCKPEIRSNIIKGNSANWGGGIYVAHMSESEITSNHIESNKAELGAGVFVRKTQKVFMADNVISYNKAERLGGGIYADNQATATVHYNFIENNQAALEGGGIWVSKDSRFYLIWLDNNSLPRYALPDNYNDQGNDPDNINLIKEEYKMNNFVNIPLRYKPIEEFLEKAISKSHRQLPEFSSVSDLSNQELLSMVVSSGFTTMSEDDQGRSIVSAEDVENSARIIFGLDANEVVHDHIVPFYVWDSEDELYYWDWPAGTAGSSRIKVINIEEKADYFIVDTVPFFSSFCFYNYEGVFIYDDYGNLVTHFLEISDHAKLSYLPFMPVRRFVLTKTADGNYYISQNYKLP